MAKAKRQAADAPTIDRRADDVLVMARSFLKYRGVNVRSGETVYMTVKDAADYVALHMVSRLEEVPNG